MKQNNNNDDLVTKGYLAQELTIFRAELQERDNKLRDELNNTLTNALDKLYQRIDPLLSELENSQINRDLSTQNDEEITRRLGNHEKRIKKLETS